MLKESCKAFREAFEPGREEAHLAACPECRAWVRDVEAIRRCGVDLPLPRGMRAALLDIPLNESRPGGDAKAGITLDALPQMPLPGELRAKLRGIPARTAMRERPPLWVIAPRYALAASLLLAAILAGALAKPTPSARKTADLVSKGVTLSIPETEVPDTKTLAGVGDVVVSGCRLANDSMRSLLGRFAELRKGPAEKGRPADEEASDDERKETHDGKRTTR